MTGLEGYAEAGYHATDWLAVYGKAFAGENDYGGMVGIRGTF